MNNESMSNVNPSIVGVPADDHLHYDKLSAAGIQAKLDPFFLKRIQNYH
jgi:hypothetical protein